MRKAWIWPVIFTIALLVPGNARALKESKGFVGDDHDAAHLASEGQDVPVAVIEVPGDDSTYTNTLVIGISPFRNHLGARLIQNRDFTTSAPPLAALPPVANGASMHGTLVADVVGSGDANYIGVANKGRIAAAFISDVTVPQNPPNPMFNSIRAAFDLYRRLANPSTDIFTNSYFTRNTNDNGANQYALFWDWFARKFDVVILKSAGNRGPANNQITMPGDAYNIITVGAVDSTFVNRANYSSYWMNGDNGMNLDQRGKPEIVAPGGNGPNSSPTSVVPGYIENDAAGAKYIGQSGTSFATPHVAGTVALVVRNGLPLPGPALRNRLAHKAIILNSARKRYLSPPKDEFDIITDLGAAEASDYDYILEVAGVPTLAVGTTGAGPQTDLWTPTQWTRLLAADPLTVQKPLDDELGTGALDAERAIIQFNGGDQAPGTVGPIGWRRSALSVGMPPEVFKITPRIPKSNFITATLTWDRRVSVSDSATANADIVDSTDTYFDRGLANFDLKIFKSGDTPVLIAASVSSNENVEHLHIPVPDSANYEIQVVNSGPLAGLEDYALAWWVHEGETEVGVQDGAPVLVTGLTAVEPNPFNPSTRVRFTLASQLRVELSVYDSSGRLVRRLIDSQPLAAGPHEATWDGRSDRGNELPSGVYLIRFNAGSAYAARKVTLLK